MRRILLIVLASILIAAGAFAEPAEFETFVIDPCGGCMGRVGVGCKSCSIIDEMTVRYRQLFGKEIKLTIHNLRMDNTQFSVLQERLSEMGVEPENVPLPVVFVNGEAFLADEVWIQRLRNSSKAGNRPGFRRCCAKRRSTKPIASRGVWYICTAHIARTAATFPNGWNTACRTGMNW